MFLIDFFVLNLNPMSAKLKSLSIFVDSRSKVNLKVKYEERRNEARNKCNTSFHVILTGQSISEFICIIQGHLKGQKVNFKVKQEKIEVLTNKARKMCNTSFSLAFDWKIDLKYFLVIQGHAQGQFQL